MTWIRISAARRDRLDEALADYESRQSRLSHPNGEFDNKTRWTPSSTEEQSCCSSIRQPSAAYPYSLLKHCRSIEHIANLHDVDVRFLRRAYREAHPPKHPRGQEPITAYKAVMQIDSGEFVSCYDKSPWPMGKTRIEAVKNGHRGGYYVYKTPEEAAKVGLRNATHIVRCEVSGRSKYYGDGKLAFTRCKPLEVVATFLR